MTIRLWATTLDLGRVRLVYRGFPESHNCTVFTADSSGPIVFSGDDADAIMAAIEASRKPQAEPTR